MTTPWQITGLGSLPLTDPDRAARLVMDRFPDLPFWPQLTPRSPWEDIRLQFTAGLPGLTVEPIDRRVRLDPGLDLAAALTDFYQADLSGDLDRFALTEETAAGFFALGRLLDERADKPEAVKGQLIGPLTFLEGAKDEAGRMLLHHPELAPACALGLGLAGAWQIKNLPPSGEPPLIMIDDPGVYLVGSAHLGLTADQAVALIDATIEPIHRFGGRAGIHSCARCDWSILLRTGLDVLSLDAAQFGDSLLLYPGQVADFLDRGGIIAWGMIPTTGFTGQETVDSVMTQLTGFLDGLAGVGISRTRLEEQSLLTPACGLGSLTWDRARAILDLLDGVHGRLVD